MYSQKEFLYQFGQSLEKERRKRGLSQRALGKITGTTQSHVSRIENGDVDSRLSTAIELARALDIELVLVPRRRLSAVEAVAGHSKKEAAPARMDQTWERRLRALRMMLTKEPQRQDYAQAYSLLRDVYRLDQDHALDREELQLHAVDRLLDDMPDTQNVGKLIALLEDSRNRLAHNALSRPPTTSVRPAYSLDLDRDV